MRQPMSLKASQKRRLLPSALPTLRVRTPSTQIATDRKLTSLSDANLFKEAFIKAQQENEKLFGETKSE
jgi:hypothetical protein